jgi:hypothetical protein
MQVEKQFIGKTIQNITNDNWGKIEFMFTDGSSIVIEASEGFSVEFEDDCIHEYVVDENELAWRCAICGEVAPTCPSLKEKAE